ncbi:hypothetical protein MMC28_009867 [Mycoblastus sanguinarius]|nr:hypothetical protein [Mycoblastus sanguinarius]
MQAPDDAPSPISRPPSAIRDRPHYASRFSVEDLDQLLRLIPERFSTPVHTSSRLATPDIAPDDEDDDDRMSRFKKCIEVSQDFLRIEVGSLDDHRQSIDDEEYWKTEALHYRAMLDSRQDRITNKVAYWKEEACLRQEMARRYLPVSKEHCRSSIYDAAYWKAEAVHLEDVCAKIEKRESPLDMYPETPPRMFYETFYNDTSEPHPQISDSHRRSRITKRSKKPRAKGTRRKQPLQGTLMAALSDLPISSRLRSKG